MLFVIPVPFRHSREGGNPSQKRKEEIPAYAGMTKGNAGMMKGDTGMTKGNAEMTSRCKNAMLLINKIILIIH